MTADERPARPAARPWDLWRRQALAVLRLELRKGFLGSQALWLVFAALAPVVILVLRALVPRAIMDASNVSDSTLFFAGLYQGFTLRLVIFLACVGIFGNLIRREMLDRSLHYYFLAPVRRELLVVAKYLTGLTVSFSVFAVTTIMAFAVAYVRHDSRAVESFLFRGPGFGHLGAYLLVTFLACAGYGAVFLAFGCFVKSPALPALGVLGWESLHFLLPPLLKQTSVIHYLQSLCPVPIPEGPLAILSDAPPPWVAILGPLALATALVALSAWKVRRMEVSYEED